MGAPEVAYPRSDIPVGQSGPWVIEKIVVAAPAALDAAVVDSRPEWARIPPGEYTLLRHDTEAYMTDTLDEWWTQTSALAEARQRGGHLLVSGLGLGLFVEMVLGDPGCQVNRITVLEKSLDVIALVAPHLLSRYGDRLEVIHTDAFTWMPPPDARYTVGWHDIWPNARDPVCCQESQSLVARYEPYCDWQGAWTVPE